MKTLVLVRHAKSSWDNQSGGDAERKLNKRGKQDAPFMGKLIADKGIVPELIYSSPAKRARTTAKFFAEALNYPKEKIDLRDLIYDRGPRHIIMMINETSDDLNTIMLFGHNPDQTSMLNSLAGENVFNVPTCGVACIDFDIESWSEVGDKPGKLRFFEFPKKYPNRER